MEWKELSFLSFIAGINNLSKGKSMRNSLLPTNQRSFARFFATKALSQSTQNNSTKPPQLNGIELKKTEGR